MAGKNETNSTQSVSAASVLLGAAFLMATSAIGPGFSYSDGSIYR